MNRLYRLLILFLGLITLVSCKMDEVSPRKFARFMMDKNNGLTQEVQSGEYRFVLRYLPIEGEALRNQAGALTDDGYKTALEKFEGHLYFSLSVFTKDGRNIKDKLSDFSEEQMNKMRFHLKDQFKLVIQNKEVPCRLYHFEEMALAGYGVKFYLVFQDEFNEREHDVEFYFDDSLFSKETIMFTFDKKYLQKIPKVKI